MRLKLRISALELHAGDQIPRGYGIAYHDYLQDVSVCYLVPLNWVVAWWREFYGTLRRGPYWWDTTAKRLYERGFEAGTENGRQQSTWEREDVQREAKRVGWNEGYQIAVAAELAAIKSYVGDLRRDLN